MPRWGKWGARWGYGLRMGGIKHQDAMYHFHCISNIKQMHPLEIIRKLIVIIEVKLGGVFRNNKIFNIFVFI